MINCLQRKKTQQMLLQLLWPSKVEKRRKMGKKERKPVRLWNFLMKKTVYDLQKRNLP
jgi:hypothetical protein